MPFEAWQPPEEAHRELITRRIQALPVERTREKNRLHAVTASQTASRVVTNDIEVNLRHLARRIDELLRQAFNVIEDTHELQAAYDHLVSIPGVAQKSAILLLGELVRLPEGLSLRQWVAYAGLDPKRHVSGTSVEQRERISKVGNARIRRVLYMPALVAVQRDPHVRAFYDKLVGKGKKPIVATVAVMRKLLQAIYGMPGTWPGLRRQEVLRSARNTRCYCLTFERASNGQGVQLQAPAQRCGGARPRA